MTHQQPAAKKTLSRKARALIVGGVVLGVGAAVTLAAWNASEFAQGNFAAGTFALEGSTTSGTESFSPHATAGTAAVVFDSTTYGNLSASQVIYEPYWIRLAAGTTSDASLDLVGVSNTSGDNVSKLSYEIYRLAAVDTTCDAAGVSTGATKIGSGSTLSAFVDDGNTTLTKGDPTSSAGTAVNLCFVVTAAADLVQGASATTTWEFEAVSTN